MAEIEYELKEFCGQRHEKVKVWEERPYLTSALTRVISSSYAGMVLVGGGLFGVVILFVSAVEVVVF